MNQGPNELLGPSIPWKPPCSVGVAYILLANSMLPCRAFVCRVRYYVQRLMYIPEAQKRASRLLGCTSGDVVASFR
jgi:hypothetical protein